MECRNKFGDTALFFDLRSIQDMAKVIKLLWENDDLCQELIHKGKVRNAHWEESAFNRRFYEIISNLMDN